MVTGRTRGRDTAGTLRHLGRETVRFGRDRLARSARIPRRVGGVDAALLSEVLRAPVDSVEILDTSDGTTDRARLALTGRDVPGSVFVKMAAGAGAIRFFGNLARLGVNEIGFYRDIRPGLSIEAPVLLGLAQDSRTNRYLLVLEDLQVRGCAFTDTRTPLPLTHAELAIETLANLHGTLWQSPRFGAAGDLAWVSANATDPLLPLVAAALPTIGRRLVRHDPDLVPERGRVVLRHYRAIARALDTGPQTFLHGDPHPGNLYIAEGRVGLLDWQAVRRGNALRDVAYLLILALDPASRRTHERTLLDQYRSALARADGPALDPGDTWTTYRRMAAYAYVAASFTAGLGGFQGEDIATEGLRRAAVAIDDLDTPDALGLAR